ncbi:hypothetical protein JCM19239_5280 [Vibrio variabilis]|uniref:Peptidase M15A C-terminal domain-containing protein n=1 Tax=Vibrio variabilis TaxID=990271 RepID=A0ABQ0JDF0_9VIBR|nr:hypothetical protein JCM19239_5280 [Vibrio variabilis]
MSMVSTKHFHPDTDGKLRCTCGCGQYHVKQHALDQLQQVRDVLNRPLTVTSGYRCERHPEERCKPVPGQHNKGVAFDVAIVGGAQRYEVIKAGLQCGATGIGVAKTFVHLDWRDGVPMAWEY